MSERFVMKEEVRERFEKLFTNPQDAERAVRQAELAAERYWLNVKQWAGSIFASVPASEATSGFAGNIFFEFSDFSPERDDE